MPYPKDRANDEAKRRERLRVVALSDELLGTVLEIAEDRRTHTDAMMWQVPMLTLTAQAFLLQVGLGASTATLGRAIAALLGLVTALAAIQLLDKHRLHEVQLARWLEQVEVDRALPRLHSRQLQALYAGSPKASRWQQASSFSVWRYALWTFAGADALLLVISGLEGLHIWTPLTT